MDSIRSDVHQDPSKVAANTNFSTFTILPAFHPEPEGFAGLVLAQTARRVFLTDHDAGVLCNCQRNVEANASVFRHGPGVALVRHLDLFHAVPSDPGNNPCAKRHSSNSCADADDEAQETFQWCPEDLADLADLQVILAADIIYDDDLTEAFMRCMESFLTPDPSRPGLQRTLLLTTEKRFNITNYDLAPQPHAYLFFRDLFSVEGEVGGGLQGRKLDTSAIPQRFEYLRSKHLELWELKWSPHQGVQCQSLSADPERVMNIASIP
ncbi:probable methyltransferase-like protein 22 [Coccomyxa sp. Obi]|nr:probable methyltransferase-like protein 22 [Coccomyxa sp. Obi]